MKLVDELTAFVGEMRADANRPKLWFGIWSGYAVSLGFGALAVIASVVGLVGWHDAFAWLVGIKLATNTFALVGLWRNKRVIETQVLNTFADVVCITAAIYFTGGPYSPLIPAYVIVITVLAMLSNVGITIAVASVIVVMFATMVILMVVGVLPPTPVPGAPGQVPTVAYAVVVIIYAALVIGVPAWFAAATLRQLRAKEQDLETRTRQLIQTATQRSQFVASMTHELRTPIHGVQGLADVVAAGVYGPVTPKQIDACASIKRSAQSLLELVDDLLNLTRAEAGKIEARPVEIDVGTLVENVSDAVSWIVGTKRLVLEVQLEPDLPAVVSDERWLAHVFVNLLANAVKFTPDGGKIAFRARRREFNGGELAVAFEVADTGIGIAPEDRSAIFEPFRQVASGDAKGYGGVGLGLALVARLTDLLGARVELESEVNKGSTFRVVVPCAWNGRTSTLMMRPVRTSAILSSQQ
ncbi:MAG: HAMP domain-containing sensor histidine kinase [Proteobacteria bacterium]|nr:HAMP domain-containing sensor histidine kinase [Pseudomonadota bacterium]